MTKKLSDTILEERYLQQGEKNWDDVANRMARSVALQERPDLFETWKTKFLDSLIGFDFIPGGRIISNVGKAKQYCMNCISGDTLVHTKDGLVEAKHLSGKISTLSIDGVFREAEWKSYGNQKIYEVFLENGDTIKATEGHEWVAGSKDRVYTTLQLVGKKIPLQHISNFEYEEVQYLDGVRNGMIFGDGWIQRKEYDICEIRQYGENVYLLDRYFENSRWCDHKGHDRVKKATVKGKHYKSFPTTNNRSYLRGFIAGLIATDGSYSSGGLVIHSVNEETILSLKGLCSEAGIPSRSHQVVVSKNPYTDEDRIMYRLRVPKSSVYGDDKLILKDTHREQINGQKLKGRSSVLVTHIKELGVEEVFCCVEPETHTMVVGNGYLTKQCNVIDVEDSRESIGDMLKEILVISGTGGGVGVSFSKLRPKGTPIATNGGFSSGPISFMHCADAVAATIKTGGGRRAALMISLSIYHPDIEAFLHEKLDLGRLTNANISVEIDNKFIQAVKDNSEWNLTWAGRAIRTVKAKDLWDKIITNAYKCGEPGIINLGFMNEMNNSHYYANIVTTNPCGEIPGIPYAACDLGSINVSNFVKNGQFDRKGFEATIEVAVRFLDNIVSLNDYALDKIKAVETSDRRIGLGLCGLHYALMKMGVKYSTEEGIEQVEKIYEILRNHSYWSSTELAKEKGSFPKYEPEKFLKGTFVKTLPTKIREKIRKDGIRNVCLNTQAPTGTTSILARVSSGIEPIYAPIYERTFFSGDDKKKEIVADELFLQMVEEGKKIDIFEGAMDITPEQHIQIQEAAQRYIDQSISKTINLPKGFELNDLSEIVLKYMSKLKGITFYRDGSRGDSPLKPLDIHKIDINKYIKKAKDTDADDCDGKGNDCANGVCNL